MLRLWAALRSGRTDASLPQRRGDGQAGVPPAERKPSAHEGDQLGRMPDSPLFRSRSSRLRATHFSRVDQPGQFDGFSQVATG